jgi:sulfide:quinone oxidoreductase
VDPATLATKVENVYAVGDVVEMKTGSGLPFPKAGVFAEAAGEVVGENIAELLRGGEPVATFDGHGYCFLEVGEGQATRVMGDFLSSPPDVEVEPAAPEHLAAKHRFEAERLARWFGE